ncbi:protein required for attachment to host cells [Roseimicrobium gellanilyticum]|uniref:Protein required for attachment to host cells n=1 Tax=Roseimicrobium gellanilyticum TaxID=748857 RepID=A0A366H5D5_9BACT|nr:host attachment protein [Roseimicrobium gellanilyticum]RBP36584.1 protein required for attachment to host cells [Roseimicrobium gellanilyticum]
MAKKHLPDLIIAADRGRFIAYTPNESGSLKALSIAEIPEGLNKLSEQVTDKAGAFPMMGPNRGSGVNGTFTGSAERLTLEAEIEMQSFRKVASNIESLVSRRQPKSWGFAAPSEINGAILDGVGLQAKQNLVTNLRQDLVNVPADQIAKKFSNGV